MQYLINRNIVLSQYINIKLQLYCIKDETIQLQLPAWRPGRYELANYAQKIKKVEVHYVGQKITVFKATKDLWTFTAPEAGAYEIIYDFHASQMDAGGSWSDDEQLYLNFINFIFDIKGRENESIEVKINLPEDFNVGTALHQTSTFCFTADNFQHLVDSPLIASPSISHYYYNIGPAKFHLWFQGKVHFDVDKLMDDFKSFTQKQIDAFGEFPASDYHFLLQLLPYKHYHGVEHQYSTVITIGPSEKLKEKEFLNDLIGVSSHELFHFWNVCRIRPKELMPYDFSKEAYIDTGVVAEGVTTYMGDLFLLKSGYYSLEEYLKILEKLLNREYENFGWQNQSIVASSMDLWLDGYKPGIPDKKVSIYNRGTLISLTLDLILLDKGSSLHEVMRQMWQTFGKTKIGYTLEDYKSIITGCTQDETLINVFFEKYISGTEDFWPLLEKQLNSIGIIGNIVPRSSYIEGKLGLIINEAGKLSKIHPNSPAADLLMIGDELKELNGKKFSLKFETADAEINIKLNRFGRDITVTVLPGTDAIYVHHQLTLTDSTEKRNQWLK